MELKMKVKDTIDLHNLQRIIEQVTSAVPNNCNFMPTFALNDFEYIQEILITQMSSPSPVLNFLGCKVFIVDEREPGVIYFIKARPEFPEKKIIILSATANEWIYNQMFGNRIKFYDLGNVELQGNLVQDMSFSFSRRSLSNAKVLEYAGEKAKDMLILTFIEYKSKFKTAIKEVHFGNCRGTDTLNGEKLAIIGTPHMQVGTYLLLAYQLGLKLSPTDYKMSRQRVEYNGMEFIFYTFENPMLRNIQFFFIESELRQAVGRARLVRQPEADVLLMSNYPLPEAKI